MRPTLATHLEAGDGAAGDVLARLAGGCAELAELIAVGDPALAVEQADKGGGDRQTRLDLIADDLFTACLAGSPVHSVASEEHPEPALLDPAGTVAVAIDPLDGSANLATNAVVGTIFSLLPAGADPFRTAGSAQLAAGIVVYGPATTMALTVGAGTHRFVLDRRTGEWLLAETAMTIPRGTPEYAINASNRRHWEPGLRAYVDDLVAGTDGPRRADYNMRWMAAVVAEAYRILTRGGIFMCPADDRVGYREGRLRLLYEAFPIAMLVEQAGGAATDGLTRVLDRTVTHLHQRTPLVFGSADKVTRVAAYCKTVLTGDGPSLFEGDRSPLFARRGLFRS
ncbi:MAG TPA: class 1 fructose-bisphosphatase [Ilumatobacter sp.]|nr:class 1 fructose-bisphosphatase [Ilumatobacter sp.]